MRDTAPSMDSRQCLRLSLTGVVQGVGFRPFVHRLATDLELSGTIRNTAAGVEITIEGDGPSLRHFVHRLRAEAPPLARIDGVTLSRPPAQGLHGFTIVRSCNDESPATTPPPDVAMCDACAAELMDPANRRYRYPFINCVDCGPRVTIIRSLPYDRPTTSMAPFRMCPSCRAEYENPADRRFHAQPIACPVCGPHLLLGVPTDRRWSRRPELGPCEWPGHPRSSSSRLHPLARGEEALAQTIDWLRQGAVVAIKGVGGYHLAVDACNEQAVALLRARKQREAKPFALLAASIEQIREYCRVDPDEAVILRSRTRPILLLERLEDGPPLAASVAPGVDTLGFFLPPTPLHHLLAHDMGTPLVMTSGNVSDEPLAYREPQAFRQLAELADVFLTHDREIVARLDDSVGQVSGGRYRLVRRARGYVPASVAFRGSSHQILAAGAHLKNVFCLTRGCEAFLGPHIGDLDSVDAVETFRRELRHYSALLGIRPTVVACDLHPGYASTRLAREEATQSNGGDHRALVTIQHHEAHAASLLADNAHPGPVLALAFDGAGLGYDGTVWGGEFLVGDARGFTRAAHLECFPLPGGDLAAKEPWRVAVALIDHVLRKRGEVPADIGHAKEDDLEYWQRMEARLMRLPRGEELAAKPWRMLLRAVHGGAASPLCSSMGRLFDGVAALLGLRYVNRFEGEAAVALETAARRARRQQAGEHAESEEICVGSHSPVAGAPQVLAVRPLIEDVLFSLSVGLPPDEIALRFHQKLARSCAELAVALALTYQVDTVGLTGGVFQNLLLLELLSARLEQEGLRVLTHHQVPANDGGICLGQAEIAAARLEQGDGLGTAHAEAVASPAGRG